MVEAVEPGGLVLDLQVIRPNPTVEVDGQAVCEIDGEPLFRAADAATDAVDALVHTRQLVEQAVDDHDVRKHYDYGAELVDDFADKQRSCRSFAGSRNRASCASAVAFGVSRCADLFGRRAR